MDASGAVRRPKGESDGGWRGVGVGKSWAGEDKLCKDASQLRGEIKRPYGSAVSRSTFGPAAS